MNAGRRLILGHVAADRLGASLAIVVLALGMASFVVFTGSATMVRGDYHEQHRAARQPDLVVAAAGGIGAQAQAALDAMPEVSLTEPRVTVRGSLAGRPFELLAVADLDAWRLGRSEVAAGSSRSGPGELLVDVSALEGLGLEIGATTTLELDDGRSASVRIVGLSREAGRAAWFEPPAFGVTTFDALASIGLASEPNALAVELVEGHRIAGPPGADPILAEIFGRLEEAGVPVMGVELAPEAGETSLDRTLDGIDIVLGTLGAVALVSGTALVAGTVARILARQRRQLGILQSLGAGRDRLTRLHAGLIGALVVPGLLIGVLIGLVGARVLAGFVAELINVEPRAWLPAMPVIAIQVAIGLVVPGLVLLVAVWRAAGVPPVRNLRGSSAPPRISWLTPLIEIGARTTVARVGRRNALRDGSSSTLVVVALAVGGGLFLAVQSVGTGIEALPDVERADVIGYRILAALMGGVGAVIGAMGAIGLFASVTARAAERRRELAVLAAVGAGPMRLSRVLLDEALGMSVASCAGALVVWPALAFPLGQQLGETLTGISIAPRFGVEGLLLLGFVGVVSVAAMAIPVVRTLWLRPRDALAHE